MRKSILISLFLGFCFSLFSQVFVSKSMLKPNTTFEPDRQERTITITDKEISITQFSGGTKTFYLIINKIEENREYDFTENCTYYYCTTKFEDPSLGFRKAIIVVSEFKIWMALFANELEVFNYQFLK